jgi:tRNA (guanine9-N1)-methyltransferase
MELPVPVTANLEAEEHSTTTSQPLSKNAQKKAAKAARLLEQKAERRAREKEAKKRKRRERAHAGDVDPRKRRKMVGDDQIPFAAQVVIDLGFDDMMTEKVRAQFPSA